MTVNNLNQFTITTVICTYKRPILLKRAIDSVLNQTYRNIEVRIYDNNSGDETEQIVQEYMKSDSRVFYVKRKDNIGAINNIIQGIEAVETGLYSLLADDDFLFPEHYENAMEHFKRDNTLGFVCSRSIQIDVVNKRVQLLNGNWSEGIYQPSKESSTKMINSLFSLTGVVFRSEMKEKIGSMDESCNDKVYMALAASARPFYVLGRYGCVNVLHANSFTSNSGMLDVSQKMIYQAMLLSIDRITNLKITNDHRVHLLSLVNSQYYAILNWKKCHSLLFKSVEEQSLNSAFIPPLLNLSNVLLRVHKLCPKWFKPLFLRFGRLLFYIKNVILFKKGYGQQRKVSVQTIEFVKKGTSDMAIFKKLLEKDNIIL